MIPELTHWSGPAGLPRFDLIEDDDFAPAFETELSRATAAIEAISANPEPPSFENTILALETAQEGLDRVAAVFYTLASVDSNPARQALERELAPKLAAYDSKISMDARLYARVQEVARQMSATGRKGQDARITELTERWLRRSGAGLDDAARARMAEVMERLAVLSTQFSQNVLEDERDYTLPLTQDQLGGLPDWLVTAMAAAAKERGQDGYVVTLNRSLIVPFLEYSTNRPLREVAWTAWVARGSGTGAGGQATNNLPIIAEILALRHERARLLGYDDFAAFKLEPEMAKTPARVEALLTEVWQAARQHAARDEAELTQMLHEDGINGALEPWDWRFYAGQLRRKQHHLDEAEVKPYLTLDAMLGAVFDTAKRLFNLDVTPFEAPLWSPDARAWRITRDGTEMAVFIGDFFARPSKRSGAWCSSLQKQHHMGQGQRAIVTNICNFTPPAKEGAPAFLSWDDAHTLFHEFGHALHHILSDVDYPSISGTSVARDFVELPSQLFEHWLDQPEVLETHARHWQTGAAMPADLRQRVLAAGQADQGFKTLEYLQSALVDLAFHKGEPACDPMAKQAEVLAALGAPKAIPMRHATPHFAHVFSGDGYSSGYYSYMWSEVMDADAFAAFIEGEGPFDPAVAARLETAILSRGGSAPADELWTAFRGRMPGAGPLLAGRGLA